MTTIETSAGEAVRATLKARHRREIGELDYRRGVIVLDRQGLSQTRIAQLLGVKQPTIHRVIERAKSVPMPRDGFSGADPFEICERYAADVIDRTQLVDELTRWNYAPRGTLATELDDLIVDPAGSFGDVERALRQGLIDDDVFDEVADRIEAQTAVA
ncbi:helix-turn-helix domain-containing protein [Microbacterium sp. KSW2-21]|uniref:Helix-turn-helix domain-containing protein n=1 Tax=Microbacterium algihabitans TaxID=3075992 RepID=A0ABU3S067_9MICO|nr:helix-turn-helix domain-containing protein [Microbacterium sp. KSW2-21]MDU0328524.1 helix-turn-helix domain-containing protein [Microbacterium sp. KSW2-21]